MALKKGTKLLTPTQKKILLIIGKNMKEVRDLRGWTLEEIEERGFKNWTHYKALESGKKNMNLTTFLLACAVLDTTPNRLLKGLNLKDSLK
ncbi:MAG: helix-turn-helix transcriptional regulator [Bdellovibrionales bacterium]|nr:helix-turn-helix transcriptional regulator [Bdellovibrionales bacterium]